MSTAKKLDAHHINEAFLGPKELKEKYNSLALEDIKEDVSLLAKYFVGGIKVGDIFIDEEGSIRRVSKVSKDHFYAGVGTIYDGGGGSSPIFDGAITDKFLISDYRIDHYRSASFHFEPGSDYLDKIPVVIAKIQVRVWVPVSKD